MSSMIAQEVRKVQFSTQGLFAVKGQTHYTYFGLEVSKESKRKNFYNSLLFDLNYIDYSFQSQSHELMIKVSASKNFLYERKWYYHEFGLGVSAFKFNFSNYTWYNVSKVYGVGLLPSFSIGTKIKKVKIGIGSNCMFGIGHRRKQYDFTDEIYKKIVSDIYLNVYMKLSMEL